MMKRPAGAARRPKEAEGVDYAALADFRYAIRRFLAFSEAAAAEAGVTSQQHQALLTIKALAGGQGIGIGTLAERLLLRQHSVVELVDRLAGAGLVQRAADPADGRRVLVTLTKDGETCLRSLSGVHLDEIKSIGPTLMAILADLQSHPSARPKDRK
ncbi:MAG TPA: MarR family winged helix-turn-helix transcriptional regulator [Alphaproteobacteria bacterium]|jgi:DNA-binding MarR family transcriptional regulator